MRDVKTVESHSSTEFEQPFCDIEISPEPLSPAEYVQFMKKLKGNVTRDMKFSDTEVTMTSLDLYQLIHFNTDQVSKIYFYLGFKKGRVVSFFKGVIVTVVLFIAYQLLFGN